MYINRCVVCGKQFQTTRKTAKYCKGPHINICPVCGKAEVVTKNQTNKFQNCNITCSYECRVKKTQQTSLEKYGCKTPGNNPEARQKAKSTMLNKYGAPTTLQSTELKNRVNHTIKERYGVDNIQQNAEIKRKTVKTQKAKFGGKLAFNQPISYQHRHETIVKRYGSEKSFGQCIKAKICDALEEQYGIREPINIPEIAAKREKSMLENWGVVNPFESEVIRQKAQDTMEQIYGVRNASHSPELRDKAAETFKANHSESNRISLINQMFSDILTENNIEHELEFYLDGKWFDFVLPQNRMLIEIDPTYTHNFHYNHWGTPYPKDYQLTKTKIAETNNYMCIHIFDWDELDKIIDLITPKTCIGARKCELQEVSEAQSAEFLRINHLQNSCKGQEICLGLYYDDTLVEIMTFGKPRYNTNYTWELLRLCTCRNYKIIGGASKLFKYAVKNYSLDNIISYCDRSKFQGQVYKNIGMTFSKFTEPNTIWSDGKKHITQNLLNSRGYDQLFNANYGKGASNEQLMLEHGWLPIGDCGQAVYEYRSENL